MYRARIRHLCRRCVIAAFFCLLSPSAGASPATDDAIDVSSRLIPFVDHAFMASMDKVRLQLHPPTRREVVFTFDAPWEGPQSAYVSVLADGPLYRTYYRGGGDQSVEYACVAESRDGIHWTRPQLGLFEHRGSRNNNIVYKPREKSYREAHNFAPFVDANPAAKPEQRYKAVGLGRIYDAKGDGQRVLMTLASPDGLHWKRILDDPVMTDGSFDSLNTVFWDVNLRKYVCYLRAGREGKRAIRRSLSDDFMHWSAPQWLEYGDAPLEQFYTNGITPYVRAPQLYIGLPMRFVPERKTIGADGRRVDGVSDAIFMSSHDGLNFNRPFLEAFIRPGLDAPNWGNAHGNNTPAWGMLATSDSEISIYWAEHYDATPRLVRGTVRADGFVSVNAPYGGGEFITRPLTFRAGALVLNYSTSAVGSIRLEVQDINGKAIPGFSLADAEEIYGDEIARAASWRSRPDLDRLSSQKLRLRFVMKDADLYSIRFATP